MALAGSLQFSPSSRICRNREPGKRFKYGVGRRNQHLRAAALSSCASRQDTRSCGLLACVNRPIISLPYRYNVLRCHSFMYFGQNVTIPAMKAATVALTRSCEALQGSPVVTKFGPAIGIIIFALWGLRPLMRMSRNVLLHKTDSSWRRSTTNYVMTSYLQPILLWIGAMLICRGLEPIAMPTENSQLVKQRLLTFVKSLATVLAFACCLSSAIQQAQKYFMETNDPSDTKNMGFQFAGNAVYTAVWVAAASLFMELLGFSTQKWLTAGGLGTVLLTLAGREIFTNFLSSAMIHATRPFVVNDWIQTKIDGCEVSGTVEHVGWWSPTVIRGDDREAVHIPNHKFTVNVVRNLSQKTHWRIKTHLAISHLDVKKINYIVADMRKVLAKNPQVEQQRLHRRVFLEDINPENQALMILISCFVKTPHFEEYLCVKEAILLDLLRVIRHHRARLATPICTIHKVYDDGDMESVSFSETIFTRDTPASRRPLFLIEPSQKINGEDKSKAQSRSVRTSGERESGTVGQPTPDPKTDGKVRGTSTPELNNTKDSNSKPGNLGENKVVETSNSRDGTTVKRPKSELESNGAELNNTKDASNSKPDNLGENKVVETSNSRDGNATPVKRPNSELENSGADLTVPELKSSGSASNLNRNVLKNSEDILQKGVNAHGINETPSSGSQAKQVEKLPASETSKSGPTAMEENIVLGVALEGSKRTLPIEEELDTSAEAKELTTRRNGHTNSASEKDETDK